MYCLFPPAHAATSEDESERGEGGLFDDHPLFLLLLLLVCEGIQEVPLSELSWGKNVRVRYACACDAFHNRPSGAHSAHRRRGELELSQIRKDAVEQIRYKLIHTGPNLFSPRVSDVHF